MKTSKRKSRSKIIDGMFRLDSSGRYCGKSMKHWKGVAKKLVVDALLRASSMDIRSLPGYLAHKQLMALAVMEDAELVDELLKDRDRFVKSTARVLQSLQLTPAERKRRDKSLKR